MENGILNSTSNDVMTGDTKHEDHTFSKTSEHALKLDENANSWEEILQTLKYSKDEKVTKIYCGSHKSRLVRYIDSDRKHGLFCDITLLIGPRKHPIRAHRLVLSSASEYFKTLFTTNLKEGSQPEIELPKTEVSVMELLLDYVYIGELDVTDENIEKIVRAANYFGMLDLYDKCAQYIKTRINNRNSTEILEFAEHMGNNDLKEFAKQYTIQNFEAISSRNLHLMGMTTSLLIEIIGDNAMTIHTDATENEERLFQLGWNHLQAKSEDVLKTYLPRLLKAVHLPQVSDEFLLDIEHCIEDHTDAIAVLRDARSMKYRVEHEESAKERPKLDDDQKWRSARYGESGKLSFECRKLTVRPKESPPVKQYSDPVLIGGKFWCIYTDVYSGSYSSKYMSCFLTCLSDLGTTPIKCSCRVKIAGYDDQFNEQTVHKMNWEKGWESLANFDSLTSSQNYDKEKDSCLLNAYITVHPY